MGLFVAVVLILGALAVHEGAHAFAMWKCGVSLSEVGLGFPIPYVPHIRIRFKKFSSLPAFTLHPFLLGAYVKPTEEGDAMLEKLPYSNRAVIYGFGVLGNILYGLLLLILLRVASLGILDMKVFILLLLLFLFWWQRRVFCTHLVPIVGVLGLAGFVATFFFLPSGDVVVGPIGTIQLAHDTAKDVAGGVLFAAVISFSLAVLNMLPVYPLDGGRTMDVLMAKFGVGAQNIFRRAGSILFFALILFAFGADFKKLFLPK